MNCKDLLNVSIMLAIILIAGCSKSTEPCTPPKAIHVPLEYDTIQEALNSSSNGDTIFVADGIYRENIIWPEARGLKLLGSGKETCIIDGDSLDCVLSFGYGYECEVDSNTVVDGFTIQNGYASRGGGIRIINSGPVLSNLCITNNTSSVDYNAGGGGMYIRDSSPQIINCIIENNFAHSAGGGMALHLSNIRIIDSIIQNNTSISGGGGIYSPYCDLLLLRTDVINNESLTHWGGAIYTQDQTELTLIDLIISSNAAESGGGIACMNSIMNLDNVNISDNSATEDGGGIFIYSTNSVNISAINSIVDNNSSNLGGGICCNGDSIIIENIEISNHSAHIGGGIYIKEDSQVVIRNININNNIADIAGGIGCLNAELEIEKSLIHSNISMSSGGGIKISSYSESHITIITNCTIVNNTAYDNGGGIRCNSLANKIENCILWFNVPDQLLYDSDVTYTNIQNGWIGSGNIDSDPLFVNVENHDYHLTENSPCIDTGNPSTPLDPDNTRSDMGCYYFYH